MEALTLTTVTTPKLALLMAQIRNGCRAYMTRDTREIDPLTQLDWFQREYLPEDKPLRGYVAFVDTDAVGYGLIRLEERIIWVSGGLRQRFRGKGYGRQLFRLLTDWPGIPVYLEVLRSNERARRLYTSLGFEIVDEQPEVLTMRKGNDD